MTDYGHDLVFGAMLEASTERPLDVLQLAEVCESAGLDMVSLADHPYWSERLDTLTLLAAIASRTSRVRLLINLANLPLRPPAMLARVAVTMDLLSGGRFELGIATGSQMLWDSIVAEGGPRRGPGESVEALDEAVRVIRGLWAPGTEVRFAGKYYGLEGAKPCPAAAHDIGIWLGAYRPRMLRLTGRIADGWVPSSPALPTERLPAANAMIDQAAVEAGRSPREIRRAYNIEGDFSARCGFLKGPAAVWAEQLTELTLTQGISTYLLYRIGSADVIRRFAAEVAPAVRAAVAAERAH